MTTSRRNSDPRIEVQGADADYVLELWYRGGSVTPDHVTLSDAHDDFYEIHIRIEDLATVAKGLIEMADMARPSPQPLGDLYRMSTDEDDPLIDYNPEDPPRRLAIRTDEGTFNYTLNED